MADLATVREACRLADKETGTAPTGRSAVTAACDRITAELADYHEAKGYLGRLFLCCAPQCELQPTLAGVATQIDNYIAGCHKRSAEAQRTVAQLREQIAVAQQRRFPIQDGPSIPWTLIAPHERQAVENHGQTLERLAQRGGLSCCEALAVLEDRRWHRMNQLDAYKALHAVLAAGGDSK